MSTTLKALQRIEQDRARRSSGRPVETLPVRLSDRGRTSRLRQRMGISGRDIFRIKVAVVFLAGVCLLLVVIHNPQRRIMAPSASEPEPTLAPASGDAAKVDATVMQPDEIKQIPSGGAIMSEPTTFTQPSGDRSAAHGKSNGDVPTVSQAEKVKPWYGDAIKVLAIVYGPDPQARMAFINDRMVHPGEQVDGFVVVAIEKDGVMVSQGRERWKVLMGR